MSDQFWLFGGSVVTGVIGLIVFLASKRHTEETEESNVLASSIKAIGEVAVDIVGASSSVNDMMQNALKPVLAELEANRLELGRLRQREQEQGVMIATLQQEMEIFESKFNAALHYIGDLRRQVYAAMGVPIPPPHELDGFELD